MTRNAISRSDTLLIHSISRKQRYISEKNEIIKLAHGLKPFEEKFRKELPELSYNLYMIEKRYNEDITLCIRFSSASWEKKVVIMNRLGVMLFTKLKIMEKQSKKMKGMSRVRLAIDYYKLFSNFETIKREFAVLNGHFDIIHAYRRFIYETKKAMKNLIVDKKAIEDIITYEERLGRDARLKRIRAYKKKFLEVYNTYRSVYFEFIDEEVKSICSTVVLNEDVTWLIASYL